MIIDALRSALADRYRLERELGQGGMATVYLAEDLKHRRRVAVKVLKPELGAALGAERFLREIEVAAGLRHPHILPLYDSGEAVTKAAGLEARGSGLLYYVMPYVEGETLRSRLNRERQLPVDEALRIAREVADALAYAHAHGVVHRDIKPENILLESGHAVVADFGIAKAVASAGEATTLTATGMSLGTPSYMSPEQSAGDPDVDGRSDLYSLGCVLYEMLAGQAPFTGPTLESLVRQHITAPAPPVTQFRPLVPAPVAAALARALSKNPADRFNPVDQFGAALGESSAGLEHGAPVTPTPPGWRRHMPWIAAAAVTMLILSGVAWMARGRGGTSEASIAVLPLRMATGDSSSSALSLGVQGELITQLTQVPGLRVASRGASREYRDSDKPERQIAQELGVATLLSGDIQRVGDQVRLTLSLSDPVRGSELWAQHYDRQLTTGNLFAMQAEVANAVAAALRLRLAPGAAADSAPPTDNIAALEFFYRAEELFESRTGRDADIEAEDLASRAVALDSGFVRGWALVTRLRGWRIRTGDVPDTMPAFEAMRRTQALAPNSIEARLAEGYYRYYAQADFAGALAAMEAASRLAPREADLLYIRALLSRRLGRFDDAIRLLEQAMAAEPRNAFLLGTVGETFSIQRRYAGAEEAFNKAAELAPANSFIRMSQIMGALQIRGDTALARRLEAEARPVMSRWSAAVIALQLAAYTGDRAATAEPATTLAERDEPPPGNLAPPHLLLAALERANGNRAAAVAHADSFRIAAGRHADRVAEGVDPFGSRRVAELHLAMADALAGKKDIAIARAEAAAAQFTRERDAIEGSDMQRWLAVVYALAGEKEKAIAVLRDLLDHPGNLHRGELRLDPLWSGLRGVPAFEELAREP